MKHYNHKRKFSSINFIVIFSLFLQTFTPLIAALQQIPVSHETFYIQDGAISDLSESVDLAEFNVEQLIVNVVEDAVVHDLYASLSQDLLTCYKTIIEGQTKVNADTLIKAMPELLQYAMLHQTTRAPRPSSSSANNAIVACGGDCDLTQLIRLLASIRARIGTVNDNPCCGTILGILGDACNVPCIGENGSISEVLCEILDCCTQIATTTAEVDFNGIYTTLADIKETITECCAEIHNDFQATWTILADIENKIELFPTFTFIVTGTFILTVTVDLSGVYTAIADVKDTLTECCSEIKSDIFDTQTLIIADFGGTWTILDDCCACGPIPLFQSDVDGDGEIKLTETGKNYCLVEDIFGNIVITGGNVTVDGNDRVLIGRVVIDGEDAIFKKAKIKVPPPGDIVEVNFAGIEVTPNGSKVQILSCLIECAPTVVDASPAINGRDGVHITGANVALIQDSNIFAGKGGPNTILGNSGNGGNGVILINSLVPTIRNSYIFAGDAEDSDIDGSGLGGIGLFCENTKGLFVVNLTINGGNGGNVNSSSGNAGKGGDAIQLVTSLQSVIQLTAANGGLGGAVLNASAGTGGDGGTGILADSGEDLTLQNVIMTGNQGGDSLGSLGGGGGDGMYLLGKKVVVLESIGIAGNAGFSTFIGAGSPGGHAIHVSNQDIIVESSRATPGNGGGNSDGPGGSGGVGIHLDQASNVVLWQNFVLEGGHGGNANSLFTPGTGGIGILVSSQSDKIQIIECKINDIGTSDTVGSGILIENNIECIQIVSNRITCCSGAGIDNQAGSEAVFYNNIVTDCNPNYINVDLVRKPGPQTGFYTNVDDGAQDCDLCDLFTVITNDFQQTWTILAGFNFDCSTTVIIDLNGVFTAIADLKDTLTECCDEIKSDIFDTQTLIIDDFRQTWTILAGLNVNVDLTGVYTVIADVKTTLTECCAEIKSDIFDTDTLMIDLFEQTWTILAGQMFNITVTIQADLNGIFTSIADVKDTLTECCAEIKSDIFDTQTLIISDFAQTWTILAGLNVTVDLMGVYTAIADVKTTLTDCCSEIRSDIFDTQTLIISDFAQTWTILAELESKIDTLITITFIFTGTVEVTVDLTGVYTSLNDLKTTITECCAEIKSDFEQTWTILAALNVSVDLSGVYTSIDDLKTTLTTCCDEIQNDFSGTWTILADIESKIDAFPSFTFIFTGTVEVLVDLGGIYTVLADIENTLTTCCDEIKLDIFDTQTLIVSDFAQTWTILAGLNVNVDLSGVYTAIADVKDTLTECCSEIKSDIFDTQTLIISDFAQTWTILAGLNVNVDLSGVYTAIADIKDTLTECCSEIKSDIFDTQTLIITDFAGTWTILANLAVTASVDLSGVYTAIADIDSCCCDPIIIKPTDITNTTYVISTSGYYVFFDDINFAPASGIPAIRIISNNVRLDLCGKSLVQSNAQTGVDGIVVSGGTSGSPRENIIIQNGSVKSFTRVGVVMGTNSTTPANTACSRITISDIDTVSCGVGGIEILGTSGTEVREMAVQNCRVISCCTDTAVSPRTGLNAQFVIDGRFDGIDINQNGAGGLAVLYGFNLQSCQKCFVNQITMLTNSAATMEGLRVDTVIDSYINAINVVSNSAGLFTGVRFVGTTSGNTVSSSSVTDNIATTSALLGYSFEISTTLNTIRNNTAMNNLASSTISSIANCIGFNFDQVSSYNVASNTSSFNRAPGASGTTNYAAGFFIGTTGVGTTGVKNSTFIDNDAIVNNGFDGTRSYGFRVESLAGGNVGNAYMNNNAVRNGGGAAISDYQILADSGAAPANPGGVPLTSIRDRTISNLNANVDKFTNLRVVN